VSSPLPLGRRNKDGKGTAKEGSSLREKREKAHHLLQTSVGTLFLCLQNNNDPSKRRGERKRNPTNQKKKEKNKLKRKTPPRKRPQKKRDSSKEKSRNTCEKGNPWEGAYKSRFESERRGAVTYRKSGQRNPSSRERDTESGSSKALFADSQEA